MKYHESHIDIDARSHHSTIGDKRDDGNLVISEVLSILFYSILFYSILFYSILFFSSLLLSILSMINNEYKGESSFTSKLIEEQNIANTLKLDRTVIKKLLANHGIESINAFIDSHKEIIEKTPFLYSIRCGEDDNNRPVYKIGEHSYWLFSASEYEKRDKKGMFY